MVSEERLENGAKGTIEEHVHYKQVSVAFGYSEQDGEKTPIAYIYNIPQEMVDRGYLAVRASENGGSNPEVAEPSAFEYAVGFDCFDCTREEMEEICTQTITDIGFDAVEDTSETEDGMFVTSSEQHTTGRDQQESDVSVETIDIETQTNSDSEAAEKMTTSENEDEENKSNADESESDTDMDIDLTDEF